MINNLNGRKITQGTLWILLFAMQGIVRAEDIVPVSRGQRLSATTPTNGVIQISGTVILPPPCKLNNDQRIDIEFGDVRTDLIDGISYKSQPVPVKITCDGNPTSQLELRFKGVESGDRKSVLQTTVKGLGIQIQKNGTDFPLNTWFNVEKDDAFQLTATPTKTDIKSLEAGEFSAVATLEIAQQ